MYPINYSYGILSQWFPYSSQCGQVAVTNETSRAFTIGRGTKQGDPLSTLLFNAVLEDMFGDVRSKWQARKYGIEMSIGAESRLTSLCFADDVTLLATSVKHLKAMMEDRDKADQLYMKDIRFYAGPNIEFVLNLN